MSETPPRSARLLLAIRIGEEETLYTVAHFDPHPRVASIAIRLRKDIAGEPYDVWQDEHGQHCTCPDFTYRRGNVPDGCKHILALKAVGLLP